MSYKRGLAVVFGCAIAAAVAFAATFPRFYAKSAGPARAGLIPVSASAVPATSTLAVTLPGLPSTDPLSWSRLSTEEHIALSPFEESWDRFSDERKRKWIKIASRYPKMSPEAQKRLHERMAEWVRMTPDQRRVARENYQVSKELPKEARTNAWQAYQQLPEETKEKLAATERKRRPTVVSAPPTGKTEIKGIERLVTARDRGASGAALSAASLPPLPMAGASGAVAASSAGAAASGIPAPGSFVPATPVPVSPSEAPSIFNGS